VITAVEECASKVAQTAEFRALTPDQQDKIRSSLDSHRAGLEPVTMIPILRDRANGARSSLMQQVLADISRMAQPATPAPATSGMNDRQVPAPKPPTYVNAADIKVAYPRTYLAEEADVDEYVNELRKTLMEQIQQGKKVIV
jgi:hypothetical protein